MPRSLSETEVAGERECSAMVGEKSGKLSVRSTGRESSVTRPQKILASLIQARHSAGEEGNGSRKAVLKDSPTAPIGVLDESRSLVIGFERYFCGDDGSFDGIE